MVIDYIDAASGAALVYGYTTTSDPFENGDICTNAVASVSFTLNQAPVDHPHFYAWTRYADSATYGEMPTDATLGVLYRGRVVLAGNQDYPYQWYMSRVADPFDWAYFATDALSPVAGADADAGQMGDIITALVSYNDDYLIIGGAATIYLMRGDPAAGGSLDKLTDTTGIFGQYSYCFDESRNFYFFGAQGIYKLRADFAGLENLTMGALPALVADEAPNPSTHRITMAYDNERYGILICITTIASGANSNYFLDLRTGGFFPETYPNPCGVYSALYYNSNDKSLSGMLLGCTDGYVRTFDDAAKNDDQGATNATIDSYAVIGPAAIGVDKESRGRLKTLGITTGSDTDGVDYSLYVKDSAEEVVDAVEAADTP
ncbi:MAG: hypothetical protein ACYSTZ_08870, partial [Planctomycetota bacterium]